MKKLGVFAKKISLFIFHKRAKDGPIILGIIFKPIIRAFQYLRAGNHDIWVGVTMWYDVYRYISLPFFFSAPIFCLSVCMSVHVEWWWLKLWYILYHDTFKFGFKNQFKVTQLQIYTIQNYKTTDLKIILTNPPFMFSHQKSQIFCRAYIFSWKSSSF